MLLPTQSAWQESSALRRLSGDSIPIAKEVSGCARWAQQVLAIRRGLGSPAGTDFLDQKHNLLLVACGDLDLVTGLADQVRNVDHR